MKSCMRADEIALFLIAQLLTSIDGSRCMWRLMFTRTVLVHSRSKWQWHEDNDGTMKFIFLFINEECRAAEVEVHEVSCTARCS